MIRYVWTTTKNDERRLSTFERKILRPTYGPICDGENWRKRCSRELEELYNESYIFKVMKSDRMRWAGHVVRMERIT